MPARTTKTKPKFQQGPAGPNQLPKGGAKSVNDQLPAYTPPFSTEGPPVEDIETGPDETGFDSILFNPTDRPTESITSGAPFGPGPNAPNLPSVRQRDYTKMVASTLAASRGLSSQSRSFLARAARGL